MVKGAGDEPRTYIIERECDYVYEDGEKYAKCKIVDEITGEESDRVAGDMIERNNWHGLPNKSWVRAPREDW